MLYNTSIICTTSTAIILQAVKRSGYTQNLKAVYYTAHGRRITVYIGMTVSLKYVSYTLHIIGHCKIVYRLKVPL